MSAAILLVQLATTLFMTGLIWFVQVVHYPLFAAVGREGFARYEALHTVQTGWVVMPVMLAELASAIALVADPPGDVGRLVPLVALGLLGLVWVTTAVASVPAHGTLGGGFVETAHRALVTTNWIRTFGWTGRAALVLWVAWRVLEV